MNSQNINLRIMYNTLFLIQTKVQCIHLSTKSCCLLHVPVSMYTLVSLLQRQNYPTTCFISHFHQVAFTYIFLYLRWWSPRKHISIPRPHHLLSPSNTITPVSLTLTASKPEILEPSPPCRSPPCSPLLP